MDEGCYGLAVMLQDSCGPPAAGFRDLRPFPITIDIGPRGQNPVQHRKRRVT